MDQEDSLLLHISFTGQRSHFLTLAVQIRAPSSMRAWLCVHAVLPAFGSRRAAMAQTRFDPAEVFTFVPGANTRSSTRATLVSTNGARRSYANDATAPA